MSMPRDSDQEARPRDLEGHERCYLMNQEIGAQERHANETAQPWRNRGKSQASNAVAAEVDSEEQAAPAHRHSVPHEPATTFIRRLQP